MSNKFTHPHVILDGKWRMIDEDPAGPYFQKPLKHAVNCLSVDVREAAKVVVANVSMPINHALSSVVALEAARTQILKNGPTNNDNLRYLDVNN